MTATPELVTPAGAANRPLNASNTSGVAGGPLVILHGIADEGGAQLGGATKALSTSDTAMGTDASGVAQPAGGAGLRGWLSGIYSVLAARLPALAGGRLPTAAAIASNAPRVTAAANLAALSSAVTLSVDGMATGIAQISGNWVGTIAWYGSVDGAASYFAINVTPLGAGAGPATGSASTNGQWEFSAAGLTHVQAQMTAYASGAAAVLLAASNGSKIARVKAPSSDPLATLDPNNAPFSTATAMTANTGYAAAKSVGVNCTAAGTITLTLAGGGTIALPIAIGWQTFPFAATQFAFSGGAAASVFNLS